MKSASLVSQMQQIKSAISISNRKTNDLLLQMGSLFLFASILKGAATHTIAKNTGASPAELLFSP